MLGLVLILIAVLAALTIAFGGYPETGEETIGKSIADLRKK
jgi:hypothetical protein